MHERLPERAYQRAPKASILLMSCHPVRGRIEPRWALLARSQLGLVLLNPRLRFLARGLALLRRTHFSTRHSISSLSVRFEATAASRSLSRVFSGRRKVQFRRIPFVGSFGGRPRPRTSCDASRGLHFIMAFHAVRFALLEGNETMSDEILRALAPEGSPESGPAPRHAPDL